MKKFSEWLAEAVSPLSNGSHKSGRPPAAWEATHAIRQEIMEKVIIAQAGDPNRWRPKKYYFEGNNAVFEIIKDGNRYKISVEPL